MKLAVIRAIDHLLGRMFCFLLIPLVRGLGKVLRRDHTISNANVRTIAVAKYYGLGSITHAMPLLKALKETFPQAKVVFVTRKGNERLLSVIPWVDETLVIDDRSLAGLVSTNLSLLRAFRRLRIDLFFDLELFSAYGALVSLFSMARNRFGFFCSKDTDYKAWIYTHLMFYNFQMPVRLCYLQLGRMAGVPASASTDLLPYDIPDAVCASAVRRLAAVAPDKGNGFLAVNVNASELSFARRWPLDSFAEVVRHFASLQYHILLVGAPSEHGYVQGVIDRVADPAITPYIHNVAGLFPLDEFLAMLPHCEALLTNDTGIMNFGYAVNLPTVGIYGPNTPIRYHVDNGLHTAAYYETYCSPCIHHLDDSPCGDIADCIHSITVEEVIGHLRDTLCKTERLPSSARSIPAGTVEPFGILRTR